MNSADDDARTRILNAAGATFAELGFEKATVREISRRAEVNLASINYYFGDKWRLYLETIRHAHRFRSERAPLPDWPPGTPPEHKLRDFIRTTIYRLLVVEGLPWQHRLMLREMIEPTGAARETGQELFRPHFALLLQILGEMLPPGVPAHRRQQLGFTIVAQIMFYKLHADVPAMLIPEEERQENFQPDQLSEHILGVALSALGRQPPLGTE